MIGITSLGAAALLLAIAPETAAAVEQDVPERVRAAEHALEIVRQAQPCLNNHSLNAATHGKNAPQNILTRMRMQINRDGTLRARPAVVDQVNIGPDDSATARLLREGLVEMLSRCGPYHLPDTAFESGWREFVINIRLPGRRVGEQP